MAEIEEPPAASRPAFGGGMDLEALRQAIVGGETEVPDAMRDDAGRSRFGAPLDANDFAARMSGFVPGEPIGEEDAASTVEIIVPEVTLPSSEPHAAREATKMEEPAPVISDVDEATADDEADERSAPPPEAEEPTAPPPSDQATDYLDLDRALKDAAAAYEERLRNSGAT